MSSSSVNLCKQLIRKNYDNLTFVKRYFSSSSSTTITGKIYSTVDDDNNQIGRIKISNPSKLNAMQLSMYSEIPSVVNDLITNNSNKLRVIVLEGDGEKAFGAGSDISEFPFNRTGKEQMENYSKKENEATESLLNISLPVIAKIHGPCIGGGLNLALAADIRYCAEDSTFCIPPAVLGIGYPQELMDLLLAAVGSRSKVKELIFTSKMINAEEALSIGLVDGVCKKDELDEKIMSITKKIVKLAPKTLIAAKAGANAKTEEEYKYAKQLCDECYSSEDYKEGVQAFLEKRKAIFSGR